MFSCDSAEDTERVHWNGQPHPHVKTGTFVASSLQPSIWGLGSMTVPTNMCSLPSYNSTQERQKIVDG